MISTKQKNTCSLVVSWYKLDFRMLPFASIIVFVHGSRPSHHQPVYEHDLTLFCCHTIFVAYGLCIHLALFCLCLNREFSVI